MKKFLKLRKLTKGDKVAVLSPSSAAPVKWPHVYDLGLKRLREEFDLIPIEYPTTRKLNSSGKERTEDLLKAFADPEIKAVIATIGGDDQVTYVKEIDPKIFRNNPKPFFGFSDNTHLTNFLWVNNIPSFYGGCIFTQFAQEGKIDDFTKKYLNIALFNNGKFELEQSKQFNDEGLDWSDPTNLTKLRKYEKNEGWIWDGNMSVKGITWGGCLESIDELLRHNIQIPRLEEFDHIVLMTETSEEMPPSDYCHRVYRALGERGILSKIKAVLNGRPQAWFFDRQLSPKEKKQYTQDQRNSILKTIRKYNPYCPIVQNMDFGHTNPQVPMPYGGMVTIDSKSGRIYAEF